MTAEEYFGEWFNHFDKKEFTKLLTTLPQLYKTQNVHPEYKSIFRAFHLCSYRSLQLVVMGLDPYISNMATGLAFANPREAATIAPSLRVIKDCVLSHENAWDDQFDQTLELWARQGVLLLNSALTVSEVTGSHMMLWRPFIKSLLKDISLNNPGLTYVLMGDTAKTFKTYIGKNNDIIECNHPAFYARTGTSMPNIFKQVDECTMRKNGTKIKWIYGEQENQECNPKGI